MKSIVDNALEATNTTIEAAAKQAESAAKAADSAAMQEEAIKGVEQIAMEIQASPWYIRDPSVTECRPKGDTSFTSSVLVPIHMR